MNAQREFWKSFEKPVLGNSKDEKTDGLKRQSVFQSNRVSEEPDSLYEIDPSPHWNSGPVYILPDDCSHEEPTQQKHPGRLDELSEEEEVPDLRQVREKFNRLQAEMSAWTASASGRNAQEKTATPPQAANQVSGPSKSTPRRAAIRRKSEATTIPQKVNIQVGLDFGTSSTKAAYTQVGGRGKVHPILFHDNLKSFPSYCLPSLIAIDSTGNVYLGAEAGKHLENRSWDDGIRRLKMLIAGKHASHFNDPKISNNFKRYLKKKLGVSNAVEPERLGAIYIAHTLRKIRQIIESKREYEGTDLNISYNVAVPIDHLENNDVRAVFEYILAWAELIELEWNKKGTDLDVWAFSEVVENKATYDRSNSKGFGRNDPNARVFAVPEAVSEAAAYFASQGKQDGIHALVDMGAGTTDVSIFHLKSMGGEYSSFWYAASNVPAGGGKVEDAIAHTLGKGNGTTSAADIADFLQQLATGRDNQEPANGLEKVIKKELENLWRKTCPVWSRAYAHCKQERSWYNITLFKCGGGSRIPGFDPVFQVPWWEQLSNAGIHYHVSDFEVPDDFDSLDGRVPFERMAVAYGLTRPLPTLGRFVLPSNCPDQTPPRMDIRELGVFDDGKAIPRPGWV